MMILKRWFPLLAVVMTLFVLTWTEETTRGGKDRGGGKEFTTTRPRDFDEKDSSFSGKDVLSSFTSSSSDGGFHGGFGGKRSGEEEEEEEEEEEDEQSGGAKSGSKNTNTNNNNNNNPYSLVATIEDEDDDEEIDAEDASSSERSRSSTSSNNNNNNSGKNRVVGNKRRKCGKHGAYSEKLNECLCSALYEGDGCERVKPMPTEFKGFDCLKTFTGEFEGDLAINRDRVLKDKQVAVTLPGKEKDPDGGYRILVPNEEPLFSQFAKILPKKDEIGRSFFGTCAVVGSSGIVLNYEHGGDIDDHDMVFRFNSAPTRGFEKHVGSKTTYRITNTQNWGFHEPKTEESILIHFRAKSAIKGLFWNSKQKKPLKLYAFAPDFVEYVAQKVNFLATSGLYGILLALQRCHSVSIYGFQVSTQHGTLYHYYDPCDVPANVERDDTEWIVIRELAKHGFISFREPCVAECHETKTQCDACKEANEDFTKKKVKLPSRAKCDPNAVSKGHLEVPWRLERRQARRRGGGHNK